MSPHRQSAGNPWRVATFLLLTFGSLHVPLPQADFHNIRHHDEPGQICVFHDHLLRWHPSARHDANVAIFHWHWFLPLEQPEDDGLGEHSDQHHSNPLPSLHAQFGDWSAPDWHTDPGLQPDSRGRLLERLTLALSISNPDCLAQLHASIPPGTSASSANRADVDLSASRARTTLYQRWNC